MQVIVKPILSEKMTALTDKQNRVAFVVNKAAYSVTVKSVNTMVYQGDAKSRYTKAGVISGRTASFKKAIVTLAEGDSIDFFSNI